MDQRMFLAVALSMVVMIGFYFVFPPQPSHKAPPPAQQEERGSPGEQAGTPGQAAMAPTQPGASATQAPATAAPQPEQPALAPAKRITVETPHYIAEIDTRGGVLESLQLKDYRVTIHHINWGDLIPALHKIDFLKKWLDKPQVDPNARVEMVEHLMPGPSVFGVRFGDDLPLSTQAEQTVFHADKERIDLKAGDAPATLVLTGRTASGVTLRKSITFDPETFMLGYGAAVINYGAQPVTMRVQHLFGEGAVLPAEHHRSYTHVGPIYRADDSLDTEGAEDVSPQLLVRNVEWLAIASPYFITAAKPETTIDHGFYEGEKNPVPKVQPEWFARYGVELPVVTLDPNKQIESAFRLYFGPKRQDTLEAFGDHLQDSLDMTLEVLAKPLLAMLRWFHSYVGNFGIAIILLTIVVRVALFPLTYKGMLSMKRMQKLQPKMAAIREKYKGDRERMNREMMGLYKRYKVNPLGGCLPILLQLPIFFALYSALGSAIELRHTPFFGWINDLSSMDPLFIFPVLMGISMVVQQRMTPTTADPMQAKILMWMPVVFTMFMFTFPSGLVLYWFTSNLLSVLQQTVINRVKIPEPVEQPG